MVKKGYVKSVIMGNVKEEFSNDPELAKARGVQLVKPYEESEEGGGGDEGEERDEDDEGEEGEGGSRCEVCEGGREGSEKYRRLGNFCC